MTLRIGEEEERGKGRLINWYEERGRDGSQYPSHPLFACIVQMCIWVSVILSSSPLSPNFFLSLYLSHPSYLFILLCLPPIFISVLLHAYEFLSFNLFWSIYLSVDLFIFQFIYLLQSIHLSFPIHLSRYLVITQYVYVYVFLFIYYYNWFKQYLISNATLSLTLFVPQTWPFAK